MSYEEYKNRARYSDADLEHAKKSVRERCANIARNGCLLPPDGGSPTDAEVEMCDSIAKAILAER